MSEKWEYKVVHVGTGRWTATGLPDEVNEKFDEYGAQGWELVRTEAIQRPALLSFGVQTVAIIAFFKRRLQ